MSEIIPSADMIIRSFNQGTTMLEQLQVDVMVEAMDASVELITNNLGDMRIPESGIKQMCLAIWNNALVLRSINLGLSYNGKYKVEQMAYAHTINPSTFFTFELRPKDIYIGIGLTGDPGKHILRFDISREENIGETYRSYDIRIMTNSNPFIETISSTIVEVVRALDVPTKEYLDSLSDEQKGKLVHFRYRQLNNLAKLVARNYEGN